VGRFKEKEVKGQYYYRLLIGGSDNHRLFREHIGFDIKKKAQKLDILCSVGLKRNRFHLPIVNLLENIRKKSNLTQGQFFLDNKHVSRMKRDNRITYHRLTSMSKKHDNELISKLANSDTLWDEIIEIKTEKYDDYVYDLTVTDTHTFIVSNGLIAHNTSLANRICKDFTGEDMGKVSKIPHETRNVQFKERVEISYKGKNMTFKMIDTPGIATKIDYEDFLKYKVKKKDAKLRAKEATQGVIESIKWLDDMDVVVIVLDATQNPYNQVNITIIGNLVARNIPVLIVANKVDLKRSDIKKIEAAFPEYEVIGISAKYGDNLEEFYESIFKLSKKA
jgi:small GTP-binding protein